MGNVIPLRRAASVEQCKQITHTERLIAGQVSLWFAWARVVNRIFWGA